jgi:D-alanine-D-alanine ligase
MDEKGNGMGVKPRFSRVAVLMGGPSSERDVSLMSGESVAGALEEAGVGRVWRVVVDREGRFDWPAAEAAFVALHGKFGEDGTVQGILRGMGVPHTGSSPEASARAFDKSRAKGVLAAAGVPTAAYELLRRGEKPSLPLPAVVKPARQGSSVGVTRVFEAGQMEAALETAFALDDTVLVEAFVPGREMTVGIVGDTVFPVLQIVAPGDCFDYETKYKPGGATHLVPAPIPEAEAEACRAAAMGAFRALGCSGMGRVDIRMTDDGRPFVLELNNIPGLTSVSLLPDMARAYGWEYPELCVRILNLAEK